MRRFTAAAKLGLGLGLVCRSSGSYRRSSTVASPSIHLCFNELSNLHSQNGTHVVRSIRLNDGDDGNGVTEEMTVEASTPFEYVPSAYWYNARRSIAVGSKLVFPIYTEKNGCRDFLWTDTVKRPMEFQLSKGGIDGVSSLAEPVQCMIFGVFNGSLYWLDCISRQLFRLDENIRHEVYDPYFKEFLNVSCREPNFSASDANRVSGWHNALFFPESRKIVASSDNGMIYQFDVGNLENGWTRVNDKFLLKHFRWINTYFVAYNHHPDIGDFNLLFTLDSEKKCIRAIFMSNACDSARFVDHCIRLTELCSDYLGIEDAEKVDDFEFEFVRLGAQKFSVVVHNFSRGSSSNEAIVLLLTFEYDIITTPRASDSSKPDLDIKSQLVGTRVFRYQPMEPSRPDDVSRIDLIGAFLLPENIGCSS